MAMPGLPPLTGGGGQVDDVAPARLAHGRHHGVGIVEHRL